MRVYFLCSEIVTPDCDMLCGKISLAVAGIKNKNTQPFKKQTKIKQHRKSLIPPGLNKNALIPHETTFWMMLY